MEHNCFAKITSKETIAYIEVRECFVATFNERRLNSTLNDYKLYFKKLI